MTKPLSNTGRPIFHVDLLSLYIKDRCVLQCTEDVLVYIVPLKGRVEWEQSDRCIPICEGQYLFGYIGSSFSPQLKSISPADCLVIKFSSKQILERYLKVCCSIERVMEVVEEDSYGSIFEEALNCTSQLMMTAKEMEMAIKKTIFKEYFLDALGMKFLGHYFEHQETIHVDCTHIQRGHIDKMHQVKQIIDQNMQETLSIAELAKQVGTNEAYLKKQFKETFGTTIYGYTLQRRMEYAKNLLLQSEFTITDIAYQIGYKHATHFTAAFKKYYGQLPNHFRNQQTTPIKEMV